MSNKYYTMNEVAVRDINFAEYQRGIDKKKVNEIVEQYNVYRMQPIDLSFRDGRLWCYNGQHRVLAYMKMKKAKIPAIIHYGLTYEDEAMLFAMQHENESRVSIRDRWKAGNAAGEKMPNYIEIKNIMEDRGYKIDPSKKDGENVFTCIATIIKGYNIYGADGLRRVVDIIDAAWGSCTGRTSSDIISALFRFYGAYGKSVDWERLIKCLSKHTALSFIRDSKDERGKGGVRVAKHMVNVYNTKLRKNKLDIELIRS